MMAKYKMTSSCVCVMILVSQAIAIFPYEGYHAPMMSSPVNFPHSPYSAMHMMDHGEMIDQKLDYMKDLAKHRMAMNMYRQGFPNMGMMPGFPSSVLQPQYQNFQGAPSNRMISSQQPGGSPALSPKSAQTAQSQTSQAKKPLSRKKRFVPMPFVPFAPFTGFNPMFNMIRGAFAGRMMAARRNRMNNMRRRNRNDNQQNAATSTVILGAQSPMDNSFNAIDMAVNQLAATDPNLGNVQPVMTQNIISQPPSGQLLINEPMISQNLIVDPSAQTGQIVAQNNLGNQLIGQQNVDLALSQQPVTQQIAQQQPMDVVVAQPSLDMMGQVSGNQQIAPQQSASISQNTINNQALSLPQTTQQIFADLQQQASNQQLMGLQQAPMNGLDFVGGQQVLTDMGQQAFDQQQMFDILGGQSAQQLYGGLGQTQIDPSLNQQISAQQMNNIELQNAVNQQLVGNQFGGGIQQQATQTINDPRIAGAASLTSGTGQQANLSTLDLVANLASLNQRGMVGGAGGAAM